jgi:CRISPR-associated protein Cas1
MPRRTTSLVTPVAHLVGPGKLKVINGRLAFATGQGPPVRLDPAALRTLFCYGDVGVSDEALRLLFQHDVEVAWLTPAGHRCRGRLVRSDRSTTALRLLQHQAFAAAPWKREVAVGLVAAKIASQAQAARHYQRQGCTAAGPVLGQLRAAGRRCQEAADLDALRGVEGSASAAWFGLLGRLLLPPWVFTQRLRRPPPDPVNALLSLGYTWLLARTVARCEALGLEVALGTLHEYRPGRPSLACDLIEPLRVPAVDRWVVTLCNQQQVTPADFVTADGGVRLQPKAFARILAGWEDHWTQGGHERSLDAVLQQLVQQLRQYGTGLPTPWQDLPEGGGSGNAASDEWEGG